MTTHQSYNFKIFVKYEGGDEYEELKNIFEFSIIEELDKLQKTLRLTLFAKHLQKLPDFIKVEHLGGRVDLFKVAETSAIDLHKKEIIAKTPLQTVPSFTTLKEATAKFPVSVEVLDIKQNNDIVAEFSEINNINELEAAFEKCGVWWYFDSKNVLVITEFFGIYDKWRNDLKDIKEIDLPCFSKSDFMDFRFDVVTNEFLDEILVNSQNSTIDDSLKLTLIVDLSPQPLSPASAFIYTPKDEKGRKKPQSAKIVMPCHGVARIFCSHQEFFDKISISYEGLISGNVVTQKIIRDYRVLEVFEFGEGDMIGEAYGFIKSGEAPYGNNHVKKTSVRSDGLYDYRTDIIALKLPSNNGKSYTITIRCEDQEIVYKHEIEVSGYYPQDYTHSFNMVEEFNIEPNKLAANDNGIKEVKFSSYNTKTQIKLNHRIRNYTLKPLGLEVKEEWE
ncbi:MAG: hypothetical protein IKR42_00905 [Campylobacter sp.]|nr:hypothetical protein [Campylobacter sp.]